MGLIDHTFFIINNYFNRLSLILKLFNISGRLIFNQIIIWHFSFKNAKKYYIKIKLTSFSFFENELSRLFILNSLINALI
jgi:hypothetical protein